MEKEQNALVLMFIIVIIVGGAFIVLKRTNFKLDFLNNKEQEQEPKEKEDKKDYSQYIGKYYDPHTGSIELTIIDLKKNNIDFTIEVKENDEIITLKEKEVTDTLDNSYYFNYTDSYDNPGKGSITIGEGNIILTLDTDIPDTNEKGISIGNYGGIKLLKDTDKNRNNYDELTGEYQIEINENEMLKLDISDISKSSIQLKMSHESKDESGRSITTNYSIQYGKVIEDTYTFKYTNLTKTNKGECVITVKDDNLYISFYDDESLEKIIPNMVMREISKKDSNTKPETKPEEQKPETQE